MRQASLKVRPSLTSVPRKKLKTLVRWTEEKFQALDVASESILQTASLAHVELYTPI